MPTQLQLTSPKLDQNLQFKFKFPHQQDEKSIIKLKGGPKQIKEIVEEVEEIIVGSNEDLSAAENMIHEETNVKKSKGAKRRDRKRRARKMVEDKPALPQ